MIWAWLLGALAVMAILLTAIAFACLHMVFGTRCDGDPSLRYFTHEDFDGMRAQPVSFPSDRGQLLRGAVYTCGRDETPVGLVVFAHGMGGGHLSYMTEIHTFAAAALPCSPMTIRARVRPTERSWSAFIRRCATCVARLRLSVGGRICRVCRSFWRDIRGEAMPFASPSHMRATRFRES